MTRFTQQKLTHPLLTQQFKQGLRTQWLWVGGLLFLALGSFTWAVTPDFAQDWLPYTVWAGAVAGLTLLIVLFFGRQSKMLPLEPAQAPLFISRGRWGCFCLFLLSVIVMPTSVFGALCPLLWLFAMLQIHYLHNTVKTLYLTPLAKQIAYPFPLACRSWDYCKLTSIILVFLLGLMLWALSLLPNQDPLLKLYPWVLLAEVVYFILLIAAWGTRPQKNPSLFQQFLRFYLFLFIKYISLVLSYKNLLLMLQDWRHVRQHFYQANLWYWWLSHPNAPYPQDLLSKIDAVRKALPNQLPPAVNATAAPHSTPEPLSTPLYALVLSQDIPTIKQALQNGADVNAPYPPNGNTPLHIAALNGYTDIVKLLLEQPSIEKNRPNNEGKTALDLAIERNQEEVARLLT